MKIVVPMAGTGDRFVQKGYTDPKPLIKVQDKTIISRIVEMFSPEDKFVFICNDQHLATTNIKNAILELVPTATILSMPCHKKGPVYTASVAFDHIADDEPVIISYCDNPFVWDYQDFQKTMKQTAADGCILTHTGFHPHTLNNTKMAFLKTDGMVVKEIKEKSCYTDNPMSEHASTGAYYFRTGKMVKDYFQKAMDQNVSYKGEFYVTLVYNLLIADNLFVTYYDAPFVTVLGTPEEVQSFEAWQTILGSGQVKTHDDLIKCFEYWKEYNNAV